MAPTYGPDGCTQGVYQHLIFSRYRIKYENLQWSKMKMAIWFRLKCHVDFYNLKIVIIRLINYIEALIIIHHEIIVLFITFICLNPFYGQTFITLDEDTNEFITGLIFFVQDHNLIFLEPLGRRPTL
jgi:hypothetical protein